MAIRHLNATVVGAFCTVYTQTHGIIRATPAQICARYTHWKDRHEHTVEFDGGTTSIESLLEDLKNDRPAAVDLLIQASCERLRLLSRGKLAGFPRVRSLEQTDDVLQESLIKLERALRSERPTTAGAFLGLASLQIRRVLCDMARRQARRPPPGPLSTDPVGNSATDLPTEDLAAFHLEVDQLPDRLREAFSLWYYLGLTQDQIATELGCSVRTVRSWIRDAKIQLAERLGNPSP